MKNLYLLILAFFLCINAGFSQMSDGNFGDEWINFDQSYFKIPVADDGIYRISQAALSAVGIPVSQIATGNYQLYRLGEQVPIYVSSTGLLGSEDYIEFYGQKNRSELDRHLFANPDEEMLNPDYSLVTDTMSYFLTWVFGSGQNSLRFDPIPNDLSNPPPSEPFFWYDERQVFTSTYIKKRETTDGVSYSDYNETEGFGSPSLLTTQHTIQPINPVITGPASTFSTRFGTNLPASSGHTIAITLNDQSPIYQESFGGVKLKTVVTPITNSLLTDNITVKFTGTGGTNDRHSVGIISLTYPRSFDFGGTTSFAFSIEASTASKFLDIENFSNIMGNPVLYDLTNGLRIEGIVVNGRTRIVLPPSSLDRDLILFEENSAFTQVNTFSEANFVDYAEDPATYLIISNSRLYNDAQGVNQVVEYANYRSSAAGGGFTTRVVEIEDLYNQYSYGVHRHPLSIKNFIQKVRTQWNDLAYLLIIGKGREYFNVRTPAQVAGAQSTLFVPTYGFPGSDNLLTSENGQRFPAVATGRIAATSPEDISIYLKKVQDLESVQQNNGQTIEDRAWMKQILHLGGGGGGGEREVIRNHLEGMENIIENNVFGAEVTSVFKSTNDPVQQSKSEEIFDRINDGVSIITFFGHSGVGTFDFDIDNPDNYENYKKYPLMFSLGCYSGNIHTSARGISERFVYYEDRGAIGFGATTGLGFISGLNPFMSRFYSLAGGSLYGQGMGDILRATVETYNTDFNITRGPLSQQFSLQGDPAVKLNPSPGADYVVNEESVNFNPSVINVQESSFKLTFSVLNLGKFVDDSIKIVVEQEFPDGSRIIPVETKIKAPEFERSLEVDIPTYGNLSIGLNKFHITVDSDNQVDELPSLSAESNNELRVNGERGISVYITGSGIEPSYPREYAIVDDVTDFTLIARTLDPLGATKDYLLEIDTTELFNSPLIKRTTVNQSGGLIKWQPNIDWQAEEVYYWRVSPDSVSADISTNWMNSSFAYLPDSGNGNNDGWNHSHFYQLSDNLYDNLFLEEGSRKMQFADNVRDIRIRNKVFTSDDIPRFFNNGQNFGSPFRWTIPAGIQVAVLNGTTAQYWINPPRDSDGFGDYRSFGHSGQMVVFPYKTNTPEERQDLLNFLVDTIPDGSYVVLYSVQRTLTADYTPELWAQDSVDLGYNLFSILEEQGSTDVRKLESRGAVPYVFSYQKGVGKISEGIAETIDDAIVVEQGLTGFWFEGTAASEAIGPAASWEELTWKVETDNPNSENDTTSVSIFGLNSNLNIDSLIYENIREENFSLSTIDAKRFPYLRVVYNSTDIVNNTSATLDYWRIKYTGLPDAVINPASRFAISTDTITQGDQFSFEFDVENITKHNMDSLLINYTITDNNNNVVSWNERRSPLDGLSVFPISTSLETRNLIGTQTLRIELNPNEDQPELSTTNNFISFQFFVNGDQVNPLVDVTFDGIHIMNGDIVSAKPEIMVSLKDENQFLALSDTSHMRILITYPDNTTREVLYEDPNLSFFPGDNPQDKAELRYSPNFIQDGIYNLIVQAEDASGNASGELDYKTAFEVVTKRAISNVLNYPNPFSTSTRFVYTLTGDVSPDTYKIQIMTVSGKIIREITQDEIGPLKVGTHQTDYTWNGTDEYGGKLANGVYLYRMVTKNEDGGEYEKINTAANSFFTRDFGKLVILR